MEKTETEINSLLTNNNNDNGGAIISCLQKDKKKSTKIEWLKKLSPETTLFLFLFFLPRSVENKILILMIM